MIAEPSRRGIGRGIATSVILCACMCGFVANQDFAGAQQTVVVGQPIAINNDELNSLKARLEFLESRERERSNILQLPANIPPAIMPTPSVAEQPAESDSKPKMFGSWLDGLNLTSTNGDFRVHIGGQIQVDVGWAAASQAVQFGPGGTGEIPDGALLRRAAIRIDGSMYRNIDWILNVAFTGSFDNDTSPTPQPIGTIQFYEASATIKELPVVSNLKVGFFKEPFGFNHLVSSRWLNFMERQPGGDASSLISPGAMVFDWAQDELSTWALGIFHPTNNNFGFGFGDGEVGGTSRLTCLPIYADEGCRLLHFGVAGTVRSVADNQIRFRARPDVRTAPSTDEPSLADTGTINAHSQQAVDVELAAVYGPWTFQSEYYCTFLQDVVFPNQPPPAGVPRGTVHYQGCYAEVLCFLTGEHQPYDRKRGLFTRVSPLNNFTNSCGICGSGCWQVGLRYSFIDFQDQGINGATLHDVTLGLNWILNPNTRVVWNLGIDHRDPTPPGSEGWSYVFGMRFAVDF